MFVQIRFIILYDARNLVNLWLVQIIKKTATRFIYGGNLYLALFLREQKYTTATDMLMQASSPIIQKFDIQNRLK